MRECAYGREPLDVKLMVLLMLKKGYYFVLAVILGAIVAGGIYFFTQIWGKEVLYEATSTYYVEYGTDPQTGQEYTYINATTWDTIWVKSDEFLEEVRDATLSMGPALDGETLTKELLKTYISADLPSDLRMPTTRVSTPNPELTMQIARAVEQAMVSLGAGDANKEIEAIGVVIAAEEAERAMLDDRTWSAVILGGLLGLFGAVVWWLVGYFLDDSVYVPGTFEKRYGIPMLGTCNGVYTAVNFKHLFAGKTRVAVLGADADTDMGEIVTALQAALQEAAWELVPMPGLEQCPEVVTALRECDGLLLGVEAGAHDGKRLEEQLSVLEKQQIPVTAAILLHEDELLQRLYHLPGYGGKKA
ncbi:MAG: hypothetical protein IJ335_02485 [Lachnospiraceae bacterium]|nr:hypothetical protein [Lachnospiraceae bacterium]